MQRSDALRPPVPFTVSKPVLVALLCCAVVCLSATAHAQHTVQVSVKHILTSQGARSTGVYANDVAIHAAIATCNNVLQNNNTSWALEVVEILDVAGSTYQSVPLSAVYDLEAAAIADPATYHWRGDAINIYIVPNLIGAAGVCSGPGTHEIIVLDNGGLLNGSIAWLHEIGHYLGLTHTFSGTGAVSCPNSNTCDPTIGAIHATGALVACADICPDDDNIMSYNCVTPSTAVFSPCQKTEMLFELLDPAGSRGHVANQCAVYDMTATIACDTLVVTLDWTAPAALSVDIYRNNQFLLSTTQTSFVDSPGPGLHEYRVVTPQCEQTRNVFVPSGNGDVIYRLGTPFGYDSAGRLEATLLGMGHDVLVTEDLAELPCRTGERIWVMAGTGQHARALSFEDGEYLRDSLLAGVHVYVEGADVWGFDPLTPFHDHDGVSSSSTHGDDSFNSMVGFDHKTARMHLMDAVYLQAAGIANDHTDQLDPADELSGPGAGVIWRNNGSNAYATGIYYDTLPQFGKVICQSWEFGGYGGSWPLLASRYVDALGGIKGRKGFEVSGVALGVPYQFGFGGNVDPVPYTLNGLTHGAGAATIASNFVTAINALNTPVSASPDPTDSARFVVEAPGNFEFWVSTVSGSPCKVTDNPTGCSFNPMIVEVNPPLVVEFVRGDTNSDGSVNLADAITLLGYLFPGPGGPSTIECFDTADANDLGQVNLADAIEILTALFGNPPMPLVAPAVCGADPTVDTLACDTFGPCP